MCRAAGGGHRLARIFQHFRKEPPVIVGQLVGFFGVFAIRKGSLGLEEMADVSPAALHQVRGEAAALLLIPLAGEVFR